MLCVCVCVSLIIRLFTVSAAFVRGDKVGRFRNLEVQVSFFCGRVEGNAHTTRVCAQNVRGAMPSLKLLDAGGQVKEHLKYVWCRFVCES